MKTETKRLRTVTVGTVICIPCGKPVRVRRDHTMIPHGECRGGNTAAHGKARP